ncbi:MAG: hypothetical protein VR73_12460 [Gammaproteobacteria bacterium BRH_c0]|nr:MAG: hypothetical protein VR73_12460 [Gammaproteobacteria bacterium BRH_c0]
MTAIIMILLAPLAQAEKNWQGEGDLAFNKSSGNSKSESLLAKLKLEYNQERWTHSGQIDAINASSDDTRSAEAYTLLGKTEYDITERAYAFGRGRYEDNRFSGYEYQASLTTGLGMHIIATDITTFDIEGGVGYRRSEEQDTGETANEAIATAAAKYYRELTETTRFESDLFVESGADNTYVESVLAIRVKINSRLGLKVAYAVKHNTDVPVDTKKTDTLTSVGLNYSF